MFEIKEFVFKFLLLTSLIASAQISDEYNRFNMLKSSTNDTYDLRHSIPGEPEIDYPIYAYPVQTSFSCDNRHEGYYADVEARCQLFRICTNTATSDKGFAFLCPNGTLFSQVKFVCDWYRNVDCTESENFYFQNEKIGIISQDDIMETVKEMVEYPMKKKFNDNSQTKLQTKNSNNSGRNQNTNSKLKIVDKQSVTDFNVRFDNGNKNNNNNNINNNSNNNKNNNNNQNNNNNTNNRKAAVKKEQKLNRNLLQQNDEKNTQQVNSLTKSIDSNNNFNSRGLQKFAQPDKVFVNRLGELSTDITSNFDPKTAIILGQTSNLKSILENEKISSNKKENNVRNQPNTKLSFAAGVNAGLNSIHVQSTGDFSSLVPEYMSKRLNKETSLKRISKAERSQTPATNLTFRNLADNINAGFNDHFIKTESNDNLLTSSLLTGKSFQGYETAKSPAPNDLNNLRQGRQFQLLGSAFTRSGELASAASGPHNTLLNVDQSLQNNKQSSVQNSIQIPSTTFATKNLLGFQNQQQQQTETRSLLHDINNINYSDNKYLNSNEDKNDVKDVHVKTRAEKLLLQGVHQAKYESDSTTNEIDNKKLSNNDHRMLIRVFDDDDDEYEKDLKDAIIKIENNSSDLPVAKPLPITEQPQNQTQEEKKRVTLKSSFNFGLRRQLYTKKPTTLRTYPKTTTTTAKPRKYLTNRRNRYRNRFSADYSGEQDQQDLTAVANTYGSGLPNRLQNNTRQNLLRRSRPLNRKFTSTTTKPTTTNLNPTGTISSFVPFGQFQINNNNKFQNSYNNNHQGIIGDEISFANNQFTQSNNNLPKSLNTFTQIPGTNIKISKSNEDATYILSSDPRHHQYLKTSSPPSYNLKNGYVPLNEYISKTLNGEIKSLSTQTQVPNANTNTFPSYTPSNVSPNYSQISSISNIVAPTISTGFQNGFPLNYGYQTNTADQNNQLNDNNLRNTYTSAIFNNNQPQNNQNENILRNQLYINNYGNQETQGLSTKENPSTNLNIYNNLSEASVVLPDLTDSGNRFVGNYESTNYPIFNFNSLPIQQRIL